MTAQHTAAVPGSPTPGRLARDTPRPDCRHWLGEEGRYCRVGDGVRLFVPGPRCEAHTPAALQGKPEPEPGPGWPALRKGEGQ